MTPVDNELEARNLWALLESCSSLENRPDGDFSELAELRMSGGYIKNAVVRSAYLAAASGTSITNEFLWKAARLECEASGKLMVETP